MILSMFSVSQETFEKMVGEGIDNIPESYAKNIKNLAFVVEDNPSEAQRQKLKLHPGQSLFGLYEGVPLTQRGFGYNLVLPDKITLFKHPLEWASNSFEELQARVNKTIWHEVAHYYGLGHGRIHELEQS
jgi:predicted Zn-dependent protease with MMP-like domain